MQNSKMPAGAMSKREIIAMNIATGFAANPCQYSAIQIAILASTTADQLLNQLDQLGVPECNCDDNVTVHQEYLDSCIPFETVDESSDCMSRQAEVAGNSKGDELHGSPQEGIQSSHSKRSEFEEYEGTAGCWHASGHWTP